MEEVEAEVLITQSSVWFVIGSNIMVLCEMNIWLYFIQGDYKEKQIKYQD